MKQGGGVVPSHIFVLPLGVVSGLHREYWRKSLGAFGKAGGKESI